MLHVSYVNNVIKYKHTHTHILYIMLCKRNSCSLQRIHYTETMTTSNPTWWCGRRRHWGSGCRLWKSPDKPRLCCEHAQTYAYTSRFGSSTPSPTTHTHISKEKSKNRLRQQYIHKSYGYSYWSFILCGKYTHKYEPIQPLFCHSELQ